jgi:amino acid transporter
MFGRDRRFGREAPAERQQDDRGGVATAEREPAGNGNGTVTRERDVRGTGPGTATTGTGAVALDREARLRQRDRFGGFNWGADFFGWLVAVGMGVILTAIVAAAGTAIGLTNKPSAGDAGTIGIVGGALLIAIAFFAYYCGGYVAGRMSRFDGGRQGFGVWVIGLVVTLLVAAAGAVFGDQYNVFENLNLPRIPLNASDITTGGIIALAAIAVASLLGALLGGTLGRRYHRRVDRAALVD